MTVWQPHKLSSKVNHKHQRLPSKTLKQKCFFVEIGFQFAGRSLFPESVGVDLDVGVRVGVGAKYLRCYGHGFRTAREHARADFLHVSESVRVGVNSTADGCLVVSSRID